MIFDVAYCGILKTRTLIIKEAVIWGGGGGVAQENANFFLQTLIEFFFHEISSFRFDITSL